MFVDMGVCLPAQDPRCSRVLTLLSKIYLCVDMCVRLPVHYSKRPQCSG